MIYTINKTDRKILLNMKKNFILTMVFIFIIICLFKTLGQESFSGTIIDEVSELRQKKELDKAEKLLIKNIESSKNDPQLHYLLGKIYKEKQEIEKASKEMNSTIKLKPDMIEAYYELGLLYEETGLKGEAIDTFKKGIKLSHQKSNSIMQIKIFQELEKLEAFPAENQSWVEQSWAHHIKGGRLNSIHFTDEKQGIAVGSTDYNNEILIFRTEDGGNNWKQIKVDIKGALQDTFFANSKLGWSVGYEGDILPRKLIMKTSNGGVDWTAIYPDSTKGVLSSVFFLNMNEGWITGGNMVYHTLNGGIKWSKQSDFEFLKLNFNDIFFVNKDTGWLAGFEDTFNKKRGVIYKTINGGDNWIEQKNIPAIEIKSIYFTDSNTGWAAGWDGKSPYGTILITTNGGKEWRVQEKIIDKNMEITGYDFPGLLTDIYFINNTGLACGWGSNGLGLVLKTDDGGKNWYREDTDFFNITSFESIYFLNNDKGWVAGERIMSGPAIITNKK